MTGISEAERITTSRLISAETILLILLFSVSALPLGVALIDTGPGTVVAVLPFVLAVAISGVFTALKSPYYVFKVLLLLVVFQELGLIILSNGLSPSEIRILTISKDIFAVSALSISILRGRLRRIRVHIFDWLALGFILLNGLYALRSLGSVPLFALALAFKQNVMLYILYFLGRLLLFSEKQQRRAVRLLISVGFLIAIFGFAERFFLGDRFWIDIGIYELAKDRGFYDVFGRSRFEVEGLAGAMFYFVSNLSMRRLASLSAQPPLTGYFLALPLTILFFVPTAYSSNRLKGRLATATIGAALLLTIGRGGILIATLAFLAKYWKKNWLKLLGLVTLMSLVFLASGQLQYIFSLGHGGGTHLKGLQNALVILEGKPLGCGLGTGGNWALWFGGPVTSTWWDSYVGALGYQMGVVGLILFFLFFLLLFYQLYWKTNMILPPLSRKLSDAIGIAVLGLLFASFFAEAAVGFLSSGFYMILSGMMISQIDLHSVGREHL